MPIQIEEQLKRFEIPYFDGVNTLVSDNLAKRQELAHVENARSTTIGTIEKRGGSMRLGNSITATANYGIFFFENDYNLGMYRISTVSSIASIYYLNNSSLWTALTGLGTGLSVSNIFSHTIAENCLFLVNGDSNNLYVKGTDGTTVISSTTAAGHLYGSPKARKINFYKDRLYLADYTNAGGTRYKNGIMMSSRPLGILSLVDGDHASGVTSIAVTDTKYIRSTDSLDVYRGDTLIETLTITAKTEDTITVNTTSNALNSSDELWVASSYTGTKYFRWASNPASGIDVKQYDTFSISGGQNGRIKMMTNIGDVMLISNNYNLAIWNDTSLKNLDNGVGCVSDRGYVKAFDALFFVGYKGIYQTGGGSPELISSKVQKYFDGATKTGLEGSAMGVKGTSIFATLGDVTLYNADGSVKKTMTDVVVEKNLKTQNWYVHWGITATQFETYISSSNTDTLIFSSTTSGYHLYELFVGTLDEEVPGSASLSPSASASPSLSPSASVSPSASASGSPSSSVSPSASASLSPSSSVSPSSSTSMSPSASRSPSSSVSPSSSASPSFATDNEILFRIDTGNITPADDFERYCAFHKIIVEVERGSGMTCFISLDNGPFYALQGKIIKGCAIIKVVGKDEDSNTPPKARKINISIRDFSKQICKISKMAVLYMPTNEENLESI